MRRRIRRWRRRQLSRLVTVHAVEPRTVILPRGLVQVAYRRRIVFMQQPGWLG